MLFLLVSMRKVLLNWKQIIRRQLVDQTDTQESWRFMLQSRCSVATHGKPQHGLDIKADLEVEMGTEISVSIET